MKNGECWFVDMMIDCELNDWWENKLKEQGLQLEEYSEWNSYSLEVLQSMKENFSLLGLNPDQEIIEKIDRATAKKSIR